jgi:hypothetical protein
LRSVTGASNRANGAGFGVWGREADLECRWTRVRACGEARGACVQRSFDRGIRGSGDGNGSVCIFRVDRVFHGSSPSRPNHEKHEPHEIGSTGEFRTVREYRGSFEGERVLIFPPARAGGVAPIRVRIGTAAAATTFRRSAADHSVDDSRSATDAGTRVNRAGGAVEGARAALHAAIAVDNARLQTRRGCGRRRGRSTGCGTHEGKNVVGADLHASTAAHAPG